jgi:hypothetical protein
VLMLPTGHSNPSENESALSHRNRSYKILTVLFSKLTFPQVLAALLLPCAVTFVSYHESFGQDTTVVFNVRDFGATGNGTTSDHAAIKAAIEKAHSRGGGKVYFPNGTYIVDPNLSRIYIYSNMILQGESHSAIIKVKDIAGDYFDIFENGDVLTENFTVRDLTFDQNAIANTTCNVQLGIMPQIILYINQHRDIRVEDCLFIYSGTNALMFIDKTAGSVGGSTVRRNSFVFVPALSIGLHQ